MARVLLADSQPLCNEELEALFSRNGAHQVVGRCSSAEDAFAHVSSLRPDLVLVDASLGLEGSPNLVTRILEARPEARVIVLGDDHDAGLAAVAPVAARAPGARPAQPGLGQRPHRQGPVHQPRHTVRTHIQNILEKLGVHSKLEAATFAMQRSTELDPLPGAALGADEGGTQREHAP